MHTQKENNASKEGALRMPLENNPNFETRC